MRWLFIHDKASCREGVVIVTNGKISYVIGVTIVSVEQTLSQSEATESPETNSYILVF